MRRGRILILLGLILALGTAAAVFVLLQSTGAPTEGPQVERDEVVVAIQPIAEDEPVEGRLELREVPVESIPQGALRSLDGTSDMLAAGPIPQGTIVQPDLLSSFEEHMQEGELGKLVEPGHIAVAMPIAEISSVAYGIRPGDHVDVLMTFFFIDVDAETQMREPICPPTCPGTEDQQQGRISVQLPRPIAQLTLQDIRVLGVGRWKDESQAEQEQAERQRAGEESSPVPEPPHNVTLMVTRQDALVLKLARERGASIELAVRAQDDAEQAQTQAVTLDYIMARFGVNVPERQPYSLEELNQALGEQ
jgi:Flp pilus assembly protein CpaB